MLKKDVTYEDYNGEIVTDTLYFNLSKPELVELEVSEDDGYSEMLKRMIEENDRRKQVAEFKRLILMTYGVKSEDGKRFIKSQELRDEFEQTLAFEQIFFEISTNAELAAQFINSVMPKGIVPATDEAPAATPKLDATNKADLEAQFAEFLKTRNQPSAETE